MAGEDEIVDETVTCDGCGQVLAADDGLALWTCAQCFGYLLRRFRTLRARDVLTHG